MNRLVLLNPGPVSLTERVRQASISVDLCHREPEFAELTLEILGRIERVYPDFEESHDAVLLTGSGTCAVESMISSLVDRDANALVLCNGGYGERIAKMLDVCGRKHSTMVWGWEEPLDIGELVQRLARESEITHVVAVHHETTTGRLNDIEAVGHVCREHGVRLLLDAVSSFGGEEIRGDWGITALAGTANKCLHGTPGACFVLVDRGVLTRGNSASASVYLDIHRYHETQRHGLSPFTPAVPALLALREALHELEDHGGWHQRRDVYRKRSMAVRSHLETLGISGLIPWAENSSMLSSFGLPDAGSYQTIHDQLKELGFVIYAGQGDLASRIFRIATMGNISGEAMHRLLSAFDEVFAGGRSSPSRRPPSSWRLDEVAG